MAEQSTGLTLDEHFDFVIDNSGDVESAAGVEELKKDMATMVWSLVDDELIGDVLTPNIVTVIESQVRSRVENDPRINSVQESTVGQTRRGYGVDITISADSIYGDVRYSFN